MNQNIQIPEHDIERAVKSIQIFKKPVKEIGQGDRAALMVQPFNTEDIDRCLVTTPNMLRKVKGVIAILDMCKYFKGGVSSKEKFHITIGHTNIMADVYLFIAKHEEVNLGEFSPENTNFAKIPPSEIDIKFDPKKEYQFVHEIDKEKAKIGTSDVPMAEITQNKRMILAYLHFQKPIFVLPHSFYIGSRLDFQADCKVCRIAFSGRTIYDFVEADGAVGPAELRLLSEKKKMGVIEKKFNDFTLIIKDMFKKETNIAQFIGKDVRFEGSPAVGKLTATFGSSGKVKVSFDVPVESVLPEFLNAQAYIINKKFQKIKNV